MSDVGMEVNYGQMDQGAQELNTGSQQINSDLESMDAELKPTQSEWTGDANSSTSRPRRSGRSRSRT